MSHPSRKTQLIVEPNANRKHRLAKGTVMLQLNACCVRCSINLAQTRSLQNLRHCFTPLNAKIILHGSIAPGLKTQFGLTPFQQSTWLVSDQHLAICRKHRLQLASSNSVPVHPFFRNPLVVAFDVSFGHYHLSSTKHKIEVE